MRNLTMLVSAFLMNLAVGCASQSEPPKAPEPTYNRADFNPPNEFDMSFASEGVPQGPAIKRSQPAEGSYRVRMVSLEKPAAEGAR